MDEWIIDKDPKYEDEYIVTCRGAQLAMSLRWENNKWTDGTNYYDVIAWQPYPKAYGTL